MRLIDADELKGRVTFSSSQHLNAQAKTATTRIIDNAPTIDAVEVVRCKECRKHGMSNCYMWEDETTDDWMWCCDGERREDDQE